MAAALLWAGCTEHTLAPADAGLGEPADLAASTDAPAPADLDAGPVDASRAIEFAVPEVGRGLAPALTLAVRAAPGTLSRRCGRGC